ncbi:MAG: acyl carrier protein [Betaproteobacteria bacterium]
MSDGNSRTPDTLSKIQSMLSSEYDIPLDKLGPEQALAELGIDSLTTIEFMFKLEDEFSISLAEERGALSTVRDIAALVDGVREKQTGLA